MDDLTSPAASPARQRFLFGLTPPQTTTTTATMRLPSNGVATSNAAAESVASTAPLQRGRVFCFIVGCGEFGATADEVCHALSLLPQSATPRILELRRMGMMRRTERTRPTRSGRQAHVYLAVGDGGQP